MPLHVPPGVPQGQHRIALVGDFFYPQLGGVEMHVWSLAQCLMAMGHKCVVVTHAYATKPAARPAPASLRPPSPGSRRKRPRGASSVILGDEDTRERAGAAVAAGQHRAGVRYMTNGLKVYYCPVAAMVGNAAWPNFAAALSLYREILLRERITVVHAHQATSVVAHEMLLLARTMGLPCVYTDHSLFGFADVASVFVNKMVKFSMADVDHSICVSHTCRENLVLRAALPPSRTSAIPNAVDPGRFTPDPGLRWPQGTVNVVMMSRLVHRKGIDLVADVVPRICREFPAVRFIVGGDGPKRLLLEEMRERHQLHDRVEMLGAVQHSGVRDVLCRGHIFLNCSLTESFCIAILEAACCGLYVVSTRVGGVPEVLPTRMVAFAEPDPDSLVRAFRRAMARLPEVDPSAFHAEVATRYSWHDVARRTAAVYDKVAASPPTPLLERLHRLFSCGLAQGVIGLVIACFVFLMWSLAEVWRPRDDVEVAPDMPLRALPERGVSNAVGSAVAEPRKVPGVGGSAPRAGPPPGSGAQGDELGGRGAARRAAPEREDGLGSGGAAAASAAAAGGAVWHPTLSLVLPAGLAADGEPDLAVASPIAQDLAGGVIPPAFGVATERARPPWGAAGALARPRYADTAGPDAVAGAFGAGYAHGLGASTIVETDVHDPWQDGDGSPDEAGGSGSDLGDSAGSLGSSLDGADAGPSPRVSADLDSAPTAIARSGTAPPLRISDPAGVVARSPPASPTAAASPSASGAAADGGEAGGFFLAVTADARESLAVEYARMAQRRGRARTASAGAVQLSGVVPQGRGGGKRKGAS